MPSSTISEILNLVGQEVHHAEQSFGSFASDHETYAVLMEEVDEYWDWVKRKEEFRDCGEMRKELIQIAAVAVRAVFEMGRK